jgi:dihydropteroate synthase
VAPGRRGAVLPRGGDILNDIGGLPTDENARSARTTAPRCSSCIASAAEVHAHPSVTTTSCCGQEFFAEDGLAEAGISGRDHLDPGIDFAKQRADNLRITANSTAFTIFDRPSLLPVRARQSSAKHSASQPRRPRRHRRLIVHGMLHGASIFRV